MGVRSHEGEYHFLGYFESEEAAALAYDQAVREILHATQTPGSDGLVRGREFRVDFLGGRVLKRRVSTTQVPSSTGQCSSAVEQPIRNRQVVGSNPTIGSNILHRREVADGVEQAVMIEPVHPLQRGGLHLAKNLVRLPELAILPLQCLDAFTLERP